ncbi:quinon protein alcohol dehydrogenase-like superfamily [Dunaliella salina]|uniref:Quinon protein alcohol dehydrogenase-like superfamily n=1 Tax=Dunaliella salina TaxID=3046 RepID=A0ABQ7H293_DUNSA|nr:quinon protein alcohol dehydrogenase-like superfamily [Dunaliella salina]|eukprot:KAF5840969.1 quinon protein alcohol dehydrogenase-like superfamily [Dunaliella salina]
MEAMFVLDTNAGSVRRPLITSLIFGTQDGGAWLYAGTSAGDVMTINVMRTAVQLVHPATRHGVGSMIMSSSGQLLVAGGDGSLTLFSNDHMWQNMQPFCRVPGSITSLSSTPDGAALFVGTKEGSVYRVACGSFAVQSVSQGHAGPITSMGCGAGAPGLGAFAATACADGGVRLYDIQIGMLASAAHPGPSAGACLSLGLASSGPPAGELMLVTGWGDGCMRGFRHPASQPPGGGMAPVWTLPGAHATTSGCGVAAISMAHRGHLIVSGGEAGEVRVWDTATREMVQQFKQHTMRVNALSILRDDVHAITCGEDCSVKATDLPTGASRAQWQLATGPRALAVGQDQVTFVTGGRERHISVWDLRVPSPVRTLPQAHDREVDSLAFLHQGAPLLASGGGEGIVKVWDMRAGAPLAAAAAHTDQVTSLAWAPGGSCLVSGSRDGCMATWQVRA